MVFLANLGSDLHVRLFGGLQAVPAQMLDLLDIDQKPHFRMETT
ncbi:hypothetical protein TRIP_B330250 [uncultured Desulfatiglans sp.]|uniref:Uncharacterized protein n=1 Tax=Uncultured Desulfatiglans sp. TaxID=1748965 RepID=A0A653A7M6_UNCDX|nr:hypothetical protein TRIP_B330250 [uncultured Desulfatiglans sp.]